MTSVTDRSKRLAVTNREHFAKPEAGRAHDGIGDSAGGLYRGLHEWAIRLANAAGKSGKDSSQAMMMEACAEHFLTDAFSAGHMRTPRYDVQQCWDHPYHHFGTGLQEELTARVIAGLYETVSDARGPLRDYLAFMLGGGPTMVAGIPGALSVGRRRPCVGRPSRAAAPRRHPRARSRRSRSWASAIRCRRCFTTRTTRSGSGSRTTSAGSGEPPATNTCSTATCPCTGPRPRSSSASPTSTSRSSSGAPGAIWTRRRCTRWSSTASAGPRSPPRVATVPSRSCRGRARAPTVSRPGRRRASTSCCRCSCGPTSARRTRSRSSSACQPGGEIYQRLADSTPDDSISAGLVLLSPRAAFVRGVLDPMQIDPIGFMRSILARSK